MLKTCLTQSMAADQYNADPCILKDSDMATNKYTVDPYLYDSNDYIATDQYKVDLCDSTQNKTPS